MLFAGEVVQKRCPQPPRFHPVNLPASYCSGHNPTYLLLKLACVFVCLFCLFSFAKPGILSLYGFDSGLHLSGFLCIAFLCLLLVSFALQIMLKR